MRCWIRVFLTVVTFAVVAVAPCHLAASSGERVAAEYIGSTPCDEQVRTFLGGFPREATCHCVVWKLTLSTNQTSGLPHGYNLTARYRVAQRNNPNQSEDGPKVESRGAWEMVKTAREGRATVVYQIRKANETLSFERIGDNLLHLLNSRGGLMPGNGGWSYTLNRADRAEKLVNPSDADAVPDMSYRIAPMAEGPAVFAIFEGRSPWHGISRELNLPQHPGCTKVKWRVTLYQNAQTSAPANYKIEGSLFRQRAREGNWSVTTGARTDPNAVVYRLGAAGNQRELLLLKGDDNVLFFVDHAGEPMVGNADFSYTLNRTTRP